MFDSKNNTAKANRQAIAIAGDNFGLCVTGGDCYITVNNNQQVTYYLRKPPTPEDTPPTTNDTIDYLLTWSTQLTDLTGRERELVKLSNWASLGRKLSIAVLSGGAGIGKTRLAAHFAEVMTKQGWQTGFVEAVSGSHSFSNSGEIINDESPLPPKGILLLLDSPENQSHLLNNVLESLKYVDGSAKCHIRLLLISREPPEKWKNQLADIAHAFSIQSSIQLLHLGNSDAEELCKKCIHTLSPKPDNIVFDSEEFIEWLNKELELNGRPLFVLAYALMRTLSPNDSIPIGADLLLSLLERHFLPVLKTKAKQLSIPEDTLIRLTALTAISGSLSNESIESLAEKQISGLALSLGKDQLNGNWVDQWKAKGVLNKQGQLPAVKPDILAAVLLATTLSFCNDHRQPHWIAFALFANGNTTEKISDAVSRFSHVHYDYENTFEEDYDISPFLSSIEENASLASSLQPFLDSSDLNILSQQLSSKVFIAVAKPIISSNEPSLSTASLLNNLSTCFATLGDDQQSLSLVKRAVKMYKQLAERSTACFPEVAASLTNQSAASFQLGDYAEGLSSVSEAVEIYDRLAKHDPAIYETQLAIALNNQSVCAFEVGDHQLALNTANKAIEINRRLTSNPTANNEPNLAMTLVTLSNRLSSLGYNDHALTPITEAIEIYNRLAEQNAPSYKPYLAAALHNQSNIYSSLNLHDKALTSSQGAIAIREKLVLQNAAAFEADYASTLCIQADNFFQLDCYRHSVESANHAIEIYQKLISNFPAISRHKLGLAASLHNLSNALSALGKDSEALIKISTSIELLEPLYNQAQATYLVHLARALSTKAKIYTKIGDEKELENVKIKLSQLER